MNNDYLLSNTTAKNLYEKYAKNLPIIDYHNHLSLDDICNNRQYGNLYELWIKPDPYKHRAMRMCGVPEHKITGDSTPYEKFLEWCRIVPSLIGNPLYIWSHVELFEMFGIDEQISADSAKTIWEKTNAILKENCITTEKILKKFNVEICCPCFTPTDSPYLLENNKMFCPSFRADALTAPTPELIQSLSERYGEISCLSEYESAVMRLLADYRKAGCVFADHAIDEDFQFRFDRKSAEAEFVSGKNGYVLMSNMLVFLANTYAKYGLVLQLHIGARRYTSSRLRELSGPAGGYAAIGDGNITKNVTLLIDAAEKQQYGIPKTVLFPLNPADNAAISVLSGSFSKDGIAGLVTQGPAWWWCDHKFGIEQVLENMASFSLLSNFVGMTTDSRSPMSFVRHDYFRRILCSFLAKGELYCDEKVLGELIEKMCYKNARELFNKE